MSTVQSYIEKYSDSLRRENNYANVSMSILHAVSAKDVEGVKVLLDPMLGHCNNINARLAHDRIEILRTQIKKIPSSDHRWDEIREKLNINCRKRSASPER